MLHSQKSDSILVSEPDTTFYFPSALYPIQTAHIELLYPITLQSFTLIMDGEGTGHFNLNIFGHEGGANRPLLNKKITRSYTLRKDSIGRQKISLDLEKPLRFDNDYFFIQLSNFEQSMGLLCDSSLVDFCIPSTSESQASPLILEDNYKQFKYKNLKPLISLIYIKDSLESHFFNESFVVEDSLELLPSQSISWEDINNDDWIDLLIGNKLWLNKSGQINPFQTLGVRTPYSTFIDFDNDNDPDIIFFEKQGATLLTNTLGQFSFKKYFDSISVIRPSVIRVSDFNNDSFPDILVAQLWSPYPKPLPNLLLSNKKGIDLINANKLLYPNDDGINNFPDNIEMTIDPQSRYAYPNRNLNKRSRAAQFIDYDQDGDDDLYIANYFLEKDELYENDGHGNFILKMSPIDSVHLRRPNFFNNFFGHGTGISWSDYDNDGDFDFIVSQLAHPQNILTYGHTGTTIFQNINNNWNTVANNAGIQYEESHAGITFGDLDNDGLDDIVVGTFYDCRYLDVYMQNENHTFDLKTYESGLNKISGVYDICLVDYNNDGKQDITFVNEGRVRIFENTIQNDNNWLKIKLQGRSINKKGIGAVVRLHCGDNVYTKHLSSGKGQSVQPPLILHFGLSTHNKVDKIEVMWSKDNLQTIENLNEVNKLIEIIEE